MPLIQRPATDSRKRPKVRLTKDLLRDVKRGHAWIFSRALESGRSIPSGTVVDLLDRKSERAIAVGIYDGDHPIRLRVLSTNPTQEIDDSWLGGRLQQAIQLRQSVFDEETTGQRWVAGEGDGLPGLIVDRYGSVAVMKVDGGAAENFYDPSGIARWLVDHSDVQTVVQRFRERGRAGEVIAGRLPEGDGRIEFLENGLRFTADVLKGQKTGFFLDQRDNRGIVRQLAAKRTVLNLFAYSGGFSVAAGAGGAEAVTSVDLAVAAVRDAEYHWQLNEFEQQHVGSASDCFEFLAEAIGQRRHWDLVIVDPPSFAPSEKSKPNAIAAYEKLARQSAKVTCRGGFLAFASCSSHVPAHEFQQIAETALGKERRHATLLASRGLPLDHPTPLAMPELRYLKFLLFQLD